MKKNRIIDSLINLNISSKDSLKTFHIGTRDYDDLEVLRCNKSEVIVLSEVRNNENYYKKNKIYSEKEEQFQSNESKTYIDDDLFRFKSYKNLMRGKNLLDFGCSKGKFLKLSKEITKKSVGIELEQSNREYLNKIGIECFQYIEDLELKNFDIVTMNHVFEHLFDPVKTIKEISKIMNKEGLLIIEVPHAKDILLKTFNLNSFKNFTLWSEHLILHTKESLQKFVTSDNLFKLQDMSGLQRYPLTNHFNWLVNGEPGGHKIFSSLNDKLFDQAYEKYLQNIDQTDTIVGIFKKL